MAEDKKIEDKKDEKKPDEMTPTPTQAEADEWKVKLAGSSNAKVDKREVGEVPEIITPTPTQAEADAAKIVAMGGEKPTDPTAPIDQLEGTPVKRAVEADKPSGYQTRAARPKE